MRGDKIIKLLYVKEHEILVSLFREKEQKKRKRPFWYQQLCTDVSGEKEICYIHKQKLGSH